MLLQKMIKIGIKMTVKSWLFIYNRRNILSCFLISECLIVLIFGVYDLQVEKKKFAGWIIETILGFRV